MKRKIFVALLLVFALTCSLFAFTSCKDKDDGGNNTTTVEKQIPVYQGMTITNSNTSALLTNESYNLRKPMLANSNNGNNGNHYGHYKGDCTDNEGELDNNNPYPDNRDNIDDEIRDSLDVIGSTKQIYYTTANQYIYINIHISNPDKYEILSFTLNGEKYSSYMFEQGSTLETLILKVNVGNTSGIVEYTIDQIKYVEGTEIKDVKIDGDKTVKVGVRIDNQVSANISNVNIGTNSVSFTAKITDKDALISYSNGAIKAVLYDGEQLVATKDVSLGDNNIVFDALTTNRVYQYAIVAFYDDLSGNGVEAHVLNKTAFLTTPKVLFDNITVDKTNITFGFAWDESVENKALTSLKLYRGETLVENLDTEATSVGNLISGESYILIGEYQDLGDTEKIRLEFTTLPMAEYLVSITNPTSTKTGIGFEINEFDPDNVGSVTKIELYLGDHLVKEAESLDVRSFDGLLSNTTYTVKVTYAYNFNNGVGDQSAYETVDIKTDRKSAPTIEFSNVNCATNAVYLEIAKNDIDNTITEVVVELLIDGVVVKSSVFDSYCTIDELLYDTEYSMRVTVHYDLNDGNGLYSNSIFTTIATSYYVDEQGVSYKTYIDGTAEVTGFTDGALEIVIPEYVNGYKVTGIQSKVFYNKNITSVVIPGSVETIGASAFEQCYDLTKVTLNEGTKTIKTKAFWNCTPDWIVIPNSVSVIESKALYVYWDYLGSSDNIVDCGGKIYCYVASKPAEWANDFVADYKGNYIGRGLTDRKICFWDFDKFVEEDDILYAVSLDRGVSEIVKALQYKTSYVLPDMVENCTVIGIAPYAFYRIAFYSNKIEALSLPNQLEYINYAAFSGSNFDLSSNIAFPETLKYIDGHAFSNIYYGFLGVEFSGSEINIASRAFAGNYITYLGIPLNATGTIDSNAFQYCDSLKYVNIPYQMTVYNDAFLGCSQVKFACIVDRRPYYWGDEWEDGIPVSWSSYVDEQGIVYKINERITYNNQATMTVIDFWDKDATEIIIPNEVFGLAVWMIGEEAFWDTNLNKIYAPKNVHVIAERAFDSYTYVDVSYEFGSDFFDSYGHITVDGMVFSYGVDSSTTSLIKYISPCVGTKYELLRDYYDEETYTYYDLYLKPVAIAPIDLVIPSTVYGLSVVGISNYALSDTEFNSITIPNTIASISSDAFLGSTVFTSIIVENGNPKYHSAGNCLIETESGTLIKGCNNSIIPTDGSVTRIAGGAFRDCTGLTTIVIPGSVTTIGSQAFYGCSGLTSIVIPNSVTTIGYEMFRNCSSLTSVTLSNNTKTIDGYAFYGCSSLANITIPDGVTYIGFYAFKNCISLTNITIPDSVTNIDTDAFYGCSQLLQYENGVYYVDDWAVDCDSSVTEIVLRDDTRGVASQAFSNCYNLTSITIPNSVTIIGSAAFSYCNNLISITIPNSVTNIGDFAFSYCSSLTNITIPNSITNIGVYVFSNCTNLTSITLLNGLTSISSYAFSGCNKLTTITIPNSVTNIAPYAFYGCSQLIQKENGVHYVDGWVIDCDTSVTEVILRDDTRGIAYEAFYGCSNLTSITIPNSVTSIGNSAFSGCSSLASIIIPEGVTSIDTYAFAGCSSLTSITLPRGVTSIGNGMFSGCVSLEIITIHDGVTSIGDYAFYDCRSLTNITIPNGITNIGNGAFYGCSKLTNITIPNSVTSIGDYAFYGCSSLTTIIIPDSVTSIGDDAFHGCSGLTSITIPNSVTSIGIWAFEGCTALTNITIPNSVTSINHGAFAGCTALTSITLPNGITSIGNYAFSWCSGLTSITIPDSVTIIGDNAFYGCKGLTSITIPDGVTHIGGRAFMDCSGLTSIIIPDSVTIIGGEAFRDCKNLTHVTLSNSITIISSGLFFSCSNLTSVTIPDGVTSISDHAFANCSRLTSVNIPNGVTSIGDCAFSSCFRITSITFDGSISQWNAIIKGYGWNQLMNSYTIYCTDGEIASNGVVTYY